MKKLKIFSIILLSFVFSLLFIKNDVNASTLESIKDEFTYGENKILKYDVSTGEITVIDEGEMLQVINNLETSQERTSLTSYDPLKNDVKPYSVTSSGYRVTDTHEFPYRVTCRLESRTLLGDSALSERIVHGSGALVGQNIVLTCAHVIFNDQDGNNPNPNMKIYPGYNDGAKYDNGSGIDFESYYTQVYFSSDYLLGGDTAWEHDWALCVLEQPLGKYLGFFGLESFTDNSYLQDESVTLTGYPADDAFFFNSWNQWKTSGSIFDVKERYFKFYSLAYAGYSGGPVWRDSDSIIVGVGAKTDSDTSSTAIRINSNIITLVNTIRSQWEAENS